MLYSQDGIDIDMNDVSMYYSAVDKAIRALPGPLEVVVDIGAHVGSLALYAARNKGTRRVWAFEPLHYDMLVSNVYRNRLQEVIIPMPFGVDWTGGPRSFRRITNEGTFSLMASGGGPHESAVRMCVPFRNMFAGEEEKVIDYMKIDIEGGEYRLFGGEESVPLLNRVRFLDLEIHDVAREEYQPRALAPAFVKQRERDFPRIMVEWLQDQGFEDFSWTDAGAVTFSKNHKFGD